MDPIMKKVRRTITIAICPKCNSELRVVEDRDARTIMTYHCDTCGYSW